MRYGLLAALLLIAGITLTQLEREDPAYTPVLRVRTDSGLFVTMVPAVNGKKATCSEAVNSVVTQIKNSCPFCYVESAECAAKLAGMDRALAAGETLPVHTIA